MCSIKYLRNILPQDPVKYSFPKNIEATPHWQASLWLFTYFLFLSFLCNYFLLSYLYIYIFSHYLHAIAWVISFPIQYSLFCSVIPLLLLLCTVLFISLISYLLIILYALSSFPYLFHSYSDCYWRLLLKQHM